MRLNSEQAKLLSDRNGLTCYENGSMLVLKFHDDNTRNALRRDALECLHQVCNNFDSWDFTELRIELGDGEVACSGLNLQELAEYEKQDVIGPGSYFVEATVALRQLSCKTSSYIGGHIVGAGVELALSCKEVIQGTGNIRVLLPHLRMGVPYYTPGLLFLASKIGWSKLSELIITDQIPYQLGDLLDGSSKSDQPGTQAQGQAGPGGRYRK